MAFDDLRVRYDKEHFWYAEIEVNSVVYRFCENRSPIPFGLDAIPSLESTQVAPAEVDLSGGIGIRASASVSFSESMDHSIWGTVNNPVRFWSRWRAENPFYLGGRLSLFSGYIEDNSYNPMNFVRRDYVIESFSQGPNGVSITGKDPLKLASNERAKAPVESNGALNADITNTATSLTLVPIGVGDEEYPNSGIVRIGDELIEFTSRTGDTLSGLVRGYHNTQISQHSEDDSVQICLVYTSQTVFDIDFDLLVNYAGVDPIYINQQEWQAEVENTFPTTYSVIITEPTGVQELIAEFSESAPHYLYWDERVNQIRLVGIKPPPIDAPLLTFEGNLIENRTRVRDRLNLRVSTVVTNYGVIDPTQDLDESSNYRSKFVREDSDSVANYGQRAYKTIYSRWINNDNKTAAVLLNSRIGRRFSEAPRQIQFSLDAKDANVWVGDSVRVQTDLIEQQGGGFPQLFYQILSAQESANYNYSALEYSYGPSLQIDEDVEDPETRLIFLSGELLRLRSNGLGEPRTLRDIYESVFGLDDIQPDLDVRFIIENNAILGSESSSNASLDTGLWPELVTPPLIQNNGFIVGKGGNGLSDGFFVSSANDGGPAIRLQSNIRLNNLNTIGGGGGGGRLDFVGGAENSRAAGGGGAGFQVGLAGTGTGTNNPNAFFEAPENGTLTAGGRGGQISGNRQANGGRGGDLGQRGQNFGSGTVGSAGTAIQLNGFTIDYINQGTILGEVT